ncbi:hypothetical protein [Shewanella marina]|uniref:hypothetical protein n=1 Tax=Shewanella marina TaxID=487319 RepID=UPI00046EA5D1|nr:hypothetical protein [Shewanella marina]
MSARKAGLYNVLMSIGFAFLLVIMSLAVEDREFVVTSMLVLLSVWSVPFIWLVIQTQRALD